MPPKKRQRFSAFDDFPAEDSITNVSESKPLPGQAVTASPSQIERIERLKPGQMIPDRFQPRRLLPTLLRNAFFSGEITCYQAAEEWLKLSRQNEGYKTETDRLLAMGDSFDQHGQIKPITGSWQTASDGNYVFIIETGERRFWAACLQYIKKKAKDEPLLRIEVVKNPTRQRQVLENRHAEPPTAVSQACEVASLILSEMNVEPDFNIDDEYDYFRKARSQRMPAGLWEKIIPIMQLTRPRMVQLLNILQFPTPLLELANRFHLSERVLREILSLPSDQWDKMIKLSIHDNLTSDEVSQYVEPSTSLPSKTTPSVKPAKQPGKVGTGGIRRFYNAIYKLDEVSRSQAMDEIADEIFVSGQSEGLLDLMNELTKLIKVRLKNK